MRETTQRPFLATMTLRVALVAFAIFSVNLSFAQKGEDCTTCDTGGTDGKGGDTGDTGGSGSGDKGCVSNSYVDISIYGDEPSCYGDSYQLQAITYGYSNGANYSWTGPDGFTASTKVVTTNGYGLYQVTVTEYTCSNVDRTMAGIPPMEASISTYGDACSSDDQQLQARATGGSDHTYAWTGPDGFTASTQVITTNGDGTYAVTITDGSSCEETANASFTFSKIGVTLSTYGDAPCYPDMQQLQVVVTGSSDYGLRWSVPKESKLGCTSYEEKDGNIYYDCNRENLGSIITADSNGQYSVQVRISTGDNNSKYGPSYCYYNSNTITVTNPVEMVASISTYGTAPSCYPDKQQLQAVATGGSDHTYAWTGPDGFTASTQVITTNGDGTYAVTITDGSGGDCTAEASTTVSNTPSEIEVSITADDDQVYYGYTPMGCTNLEASASGGAGSFTWSWDNEASTSGIEVCPDPDNNTYTVTATDASSCSVSATYTVQVVDVRCGTNNDKVLVCMTQSANVHQVCVAQESVATLLGNGNSIGGCPQTKFSEESRLQTQVYPNPFRDDFIVEFNLDRDQHIRIELVDLNGKVVNTLFNEVAQSGQNYAVVGDARDLAKGVYFVRIASDSAVEMLRLVHQ